MNLLLIFIVVCVVFVLIAIVSVCWPLVKGKPNAQAEENERHAQVVSILRQQAQDLEKDLAQGKIDSDEYEESKMELERRVLEETRDHDDVFKGPTMATKILAVVVALLIPATAVTGYFMWGRYTAMDPAFLNLMEQQRQRQMTGHSAQDLQNSIALLVKQTKDNPQDANAWFLLARTYGSLGRYDDAVDAYKHVNAIVPNNADVLADMADVMAAANGKVITPEVVAILEKSLRADPNQWKALMLLAINSWDKQHYAEAISYWERVLRATPPDFPEREAIEANIREAKRLGGIADNASKRIDEGQAQPKLQDLPVVPTQQAVPESSIQGTVSLSEALKARVKPEDTVFIYAWPAKGSRMPVAIVKVAAKELPYHFKLTNKTTMAAGMSTLDDVKDVMVGARLSKSGNFMPQAGDMEGEIKAPVKVGDQSVDITISSER